MAPCSGIAWARGHSHIRVRALAQKFMSSGYHAYAKSCVNARMGAEEMPEISLFMGIRITMYYDDHNPPHFHAAYAGHNALVDIIDGCVIKGSLPGRQLKFVLAWAELHNDELMQNWELAREKKPLNSIAPLM